MAGKDYEALARSFASSKDGALVVEAGSRAVYLLAEACYLRYGEARWMMEANKLWRMCAKKAKARRRIVAWRGVPAKDFFFAEEICKRAQRLVAVPECQRTSKGDTSPQIKPNLTARIAQTRYEKESLPTCFEPRFIEEEAIVTTQGWPLPNDCSQPYLQCHKIPRVSEPSESSQPETDVEVTELRGELQRLKQQLSRQAQRANAHELEIRMLRESKYELLKMTSGPEAWKIQSLWRRAMARSELLKLREQAAIIAAITTLQARFRCRRVAKLYEAVSGNRALRAAQHIQGLSRYMRVRHLTAKRVQTALWAGHCRVQHGVAGIDRHLVLRLAASDATIDALNEELNLLHAAYAINVDRINGLMDRIDTLVNLAANSVIAAAVACDFQPAVDAIQTGIGGIVVPVLEALRDISAKHRDYCFIMVSVGMVGILVPIQNQSNKERLLASAILQNMATTSAST